jgi:hypothetical protein
VQAVEVQDGHIFPVTQEVFDAQANGYHVGESIKAGATVPNALILPLMQANDERGKSDSVI